MVTCPICASHVVLMIWSRPIFTDQLTEYGCMECGYLFPGMPSDKVRVWPDDFEVPDVKPAIIPHAARKWTDHFPSERHPGPQHDSNG